MGASMQLTWGRSELRMERSGHENPLLDVGRARHIRVVKGRAIAGSDHLPRPISITRRGAVKGGRSPASAHP